MNKTELITEVLNLYDVIGALKNQNEKLALNQLPSNSVAEQNISFIDKTMIEVGKKRVLENVLYSWREVNVKYDDETNTYKATSFENWIEKKINKSYIPSYISYDGFLSYFHNDLEKMYAKEKEVALAKAKKEDEENE